MSAGTGVVLPPSLASRTGPIKNDLTSAIQTGSMSVMTRSMRYRAVERALRKHNCTDKPGKGSHVKWYCPCGEHIAVVPEGGTVSPGVVADTIRKLSCLPPGWLQ
jgi:hypothetical protein